MRKRELMRWIEAASAEARRDMQANATHGVYGAGFSSEGYAGGFRDALSGIVNLLHDTVPSGRFWTAPNRKSEAGKG